MTGIFVRISREGPNGPFRPVDLDEMSNAELDSLDALMSQREAWQLWTWVKALARTLRDQRPSSPDGPPRSRKAREVEAHLALLRPLEQALVALDAYRTQHQHALRPLEQQALNTTIQELVRTVQTIIDRPGHALSPDARDGLAAEQDTSAPRGQLSGCPAPRRNTG